MNQTSTVEQEMVGRRQQSRLAWMALKLAPLMGPTRISRAVQQLGAAERVFEASLTELEAAGLPAQAAQFIFEGRGLAAAEEEASRTAIAGASFFTPDDEEYPRQLLEIYDPPPVLWLRGEVQALKRPGIAVVGTRHPSPYGSGMAEMLSRDLARKGLAVLSGMARGVDTAAHKGALDTGGVTVAVWGTGIDVVYPKENKKLAERIVDSGGAILTEFPTGTFPAPQNFPVRNRVLSGISIGVLVIEAGEYSGTRITARCAMEQNRDVFAVPGNVTNKNAWGPNTLIKQGAKLTATWEDVWEEIPSDIKVALERSTGADESKPEGTASLFHDPPVPEHERTVLDRLKQDEATQLDELMDSLEGVLGSAEIFTALFELELRGRIRQMPGKNYVRCF